MKKIISILLILVAFSGTAVYYFFFMPEEPRDLSFTLDPGDQFVTDIADSRRLLCVDVVFKVADQKNEERYVANNHVIRNAVIATLRSKTEEDLRQEHIEGGLDQEILDRLNNAFTTEDFQQVYFNTLVIQ